MAAFLQVETTSAGQLKANLFMLAAAKFTALMIQANFGVKNIKRLSHIYGRLVIMSDRRHNRSVFATARIAMPRMRLSSSVMLLLILRLLALGKLNK